MQNKIETLNPNCFYHVYNRANGNKKLHLSAENYRYFLERFYVHILPIAEIYCSCLMPNNFHFLIRIKSEIKLNKYFKERSVVKAFPKFETLERLFNPLENKLSKQFSNLFSSYTQAFIKQHNRKGSLFIKIFKREIITDNSYLIKLVHYNPYNPV